MCVCGGVDYVLSINFIVVKGINSSLIRWTIYFLFCRHTNKCYGNQKCKIPVTVILLTRVRQKVNLNLSKSYLNVLPLDHTVRGFVLFCFIVIMWGIRKCHWVKVLITLSFFLFTGVLGLHQLWRSGTIKSATVKQQELVQLFSMDLTSPYSLVFLS